MKLVSLTQSSVVYLFFSVVTKCWSLESSVWFSKKLSQVSHVYCCTHSKLCPRTPTNVGEGRKKCGADGPPCVLFSTWLVEVTLEKFSFFVQVFFHIKSYKSFLSVPLCHTWIFHEAWQNGRLEQWSQTSMPRCLVEGQNWSTAPCQRYVNVWFFRFKPFLFRLVFDRLHVYAAPKQPRLDWFMLENVPKYPVEFLKGLEATHDYQTTLISPQRFGKPMNRRGGWNTCVDGQWKKRFGKCGRFSSCWIIFGEKLNMDG